MGETRYRFAPHPSSGFLLGLRIPQLVGFILAGCARARGAAGLGGLGGLLLASRLLTLAAAVAADPGARPHARAVGARARPVPARSPRRRGRGFAPSAHSSATSSRSPTARSTRAPDEPSARCPASSRTSSSWRARLAQYDQAPASVPSRTPVPTRSPRRCTCGAARSRCSGPPSASSALRTTAPCSQPSRAMTRRSAAIGWIERTLPGDGDELGDHLLQAKRADAQPR